MLLEIMENEILGLNVDQLKAKVSKIKNELDSLSESNN